jgi:hypothetical protein
MIRRITLAVSLTALLCAATAAVGCSSEPETKGGNSSGSGGTAGGSTGGSTGSGGSGTGGSQQTGGSTASGGNSSTGGDPGSGGDPGTGGETGTGGAAETGGSTGTGGGGTGDPLTEPCAGMAGLDWKTAITTNYESYPAPGSEECIKYSGCKYAGQFQACDGKHSEDWVMNHNIVAFFPLGNMSLHDICLKSGSKSIRVTIYDTCGDGDCGGCCSDNKGSHDALIDLEKYTYQRFGVDDGEIEWADLGPTKGDGCN